jgi:hypothetical protein
MITAALARSTIRGVAALPLITKGGLETITQGVQRGVANNRFAKRWRTG